MENKSKMGRRDSCTERHKKGIAGKNDQGKRKSPYVVGYSAGVQQGRRATQSEERRGHLWGGIHKIEKKSDTDRD